MIGVHNINDALKVHAVAAEDWRYHTLVRLLHEWAERFNRAFALGIDTPVLEIDGIQAHAFAYYRRGRNSFGLRHQITFNTMYLDFPLAETLDTLLHELLHEWQELHGKPGKNNFHNRQYREKAASLGLIVDERGRSLGVKPGPFTVLLAQHGIDTTTLPPAQDTPIRVRPRGQSKMKKWTCACPIRIRAAVELQVQCLVCGHLFQKTAAAW